MSTSLNETGQFVNGALSSFAMLTAMQPVFTTKTWVMSGKGCPPWQELYRGFVPNCVAVVPAQGASFLGYAGGVKLVAKDPRNPTTGEKFVSALMGGVAAAPFATAFERVMIVEQVHKLSTLNAVKAVYGRGFTKAFVPTTAREMVFTGALLGLDPQGMWTSAAAGFAAGVVSAPFDRVKTVMQGSLVGNTSFVQTTSDLVKKGGAKSLFKGCFVRGGLVAGAITSMSQARQFFPRYLPSSMHRLPESTGSHPR